MKAARHDALTCDLLARPCGVSFATIALRLVATLVMYASMRRRVLPRSSRPLRSDGTNFASLAALMPNCDGVIRVAARNASIF